MLSRTIILMALSGFLPITALAQQPDSVTINFLVNTAFVQDTIHKKSSVSIRGGGIFGDWSLEKGLRLNHLSGDYWSGSIRAAVGTAYGPYKVVTATNSGTGWDRLELNGAVPSYDTTISLFTTGLPVSYNDPITGQEIIRGGTWNPLEIAKDGSDSIAVHFRVNMQSLETFPRQTAEVYVRGNMIDDSWSISSRGRMYPEVRHDDLTGGKGVYEAEKHFYSRTVLVDPAKKGSVAEYKFTFNNGGTTTWEDGIFDLDDGDLATNGTRIFTVNNDTTLFWKWWLNNPYIVIIEPGNFSVNFSVDLIKAINTNGFDPATDKLLVNAGYSATSPYVLVDTLKKDLIGTIYTGKIEGIYGFANSYIAYKYFKLTPAGEYSEIYFDNFDSTGTTKGPLYRKVTTDLFSSDLFVEDHADDNISSHRMPFFKNTNSVGINKTLTLEVNTNFVRNYVFSGGNFNSVTGTKFLVDSTNFDLLDVFINGPISGSWKTWNRDSLGLERKLSDDGITNGDRVANDGIHTIQLSFDANDIIGQEFKLSLGGFNNEAREGLTHLINLTGEANQLEEISFGDIDPKRFTSLKDEDGNRGTPEEIQLAQNYPNPFNPSTVISFNLPKPGLVEFDVFNILGQKIRSFNYFAGESGFHQTNFAADGLSSGTYFLTMRAGNQVRTIRMVLLR